MSARYELIDAEKATVTAAGAVKYSIRKMCEWLEVSSSGYYEWRGRPASVTAARRDRLAVLIEKAFTDSDGTYGHRRIHAQLARWGEHASPELVRGLMRELGLVACQPRPWRHSLTVADAAPAPLPDLVRRDFTAEAPGQKMVGDITYIPTWEGRAAAKSADHAVSWEFVVSGRRGGWDGCGRLASMVVPTPSVEPRATPVDVIFSEAGSACPGWRV